MASYDKILKSVLDKFQSFLSPLTEIAHNQEILIVQNKQIVSLLEKISESISVIPVVSVVPVDSANSVQSEGEEPL